MTIRWATIFLDVPAAAADDAAAFWCAVTGTMLSPWRHDTFATLVPADGDAMLRIQRVRQGPGGTHLDLHVDEPLPDAAARITALGGEIEHVEDDVILLRSPGGFRFCVVAWDGEASVPGPVTPGPTRLDQLCLDVPPAAYEREASFWGAVTGREVQLGSVPGFRRIPATKGFPVRLMLQRRQEAAPGDVVTAHTDLAAGADRATVAEHHAGLGAAVDGVFPVWTLMRDPAGRVYCLTGRDPVSGGPV